MKKITFLLIALLIASVSFSQVFFDEDFNGNIQPSGWNNFPAPSSGSQIWEFGNGVTPGGDIADFSSNAAIFNDPTGANEAYLYKYPISITDVMNDDDYALIYKIRTSLNTFGSDVQKDKLSIKVSDDSFTNNNRLHTIWETTTEHDPILRYFDIKSYLNSSWNLDYTQFRIGVVFDDLNGSNGWGAGIDDVALYARQYNDRPYSSLRPEYIINSLPYTYSQEADHQATTNGSSLPTGINPHMANGLWYKYVADFSGELTIHGKADDYDLEIGAYRQNGNTWTTIGTKDFYIDKIESLKINVTNGQTYWFNLGYWNSNATPSQMHGTQHIWVAKTPPNDTCASAIDFTSDAHNANFDNVDFTGATNNSGFVTTCGSGMNDGIWYKFTAPYTGEYNFWLDGGLGDLGVSVYTGSCGNFSCVTSQILQGLQDNGFPVTQGTTYYFNIGDSSNTEDIVENYSSNIKFYYTPPGNDMCTNATTLTVGNNFDEHDVVAELLGCTPTPGITSLSCTNGGFGNGNDIWYELTVPNNGAVRVETAAFVSSTLADTVLAAYTGTCTNLQEVACNDDGGTGSFTVLDVTGLTPGSTLYIRANEYATNNYDKFRISVYNLSTTTVEDNIIKGLTLYPNPISDFLNIESKEVITKVKVYNLIGKLVKEITPNQKKATIHLKDVAAGIYFVKTEANHKTSTKKIIKQ